MTSSQSARRTEERYLSPLERSDLKECWVEIPHTRHGAFFWLYPGDRKGFNTIAIGDKKGERENMTD